jgi:hypothetical protein
MTLFRHMHCGHNAHLHARLVSGVKVADDTVRARASGLAFRGDTPVLSLRDVLLSGACDGRLD